MSKPPSEPNVQPQSLSGRWTIAGMLLFSVLVVSSFWTYWYLANAPFRDLQAAIVEIFPHTFPQVAGGRMESSGHTGPTTLRIVVRTLDFDPKQDAAKATEMSDRLATLANQHVDLSDYEQLEIVLFHKYQEQRAAYWQQTRALK